MVLHKHERYLGWQVVIKRQKDILHEVWFTPEEEPFAPELRLDNQVWQDMGYPDSVTITVEPGNKFERGE